MMDKFNGTHRAKCPHCLGELEKHYRAWGDWYFVCVDCKKIVPPSASFQYVPIAEHFNHVENNIKEVTLNKVAAKDKREEEE